MIRRLALAALLALAPSLASAQFATIAPTPAVTDNGDRVATTAWVNNFFALGIPLANGKIFIGSAGGLATAQTPSGDCTLVPSGVITCTQSAGAFTVNGLLTVTGNASIGGSIIDANGILATNIVAPATPAAGTTRIYVDSTSKTPTGKNDAGTLSNMVTPISCSAAQWISAIAANAATTCSAIPANAVTRAMEAQGVARSVVGVTGNATANVADIQGTANQFLGVNSAGTALAFATMSQDCTLATGVITCTKTNNVAFAASATTDTTNATNISSGTLANARSAATNLAAGNVNGGVTGTLPLANGGTGDTGTAYSVTTPTPTASSGTFTTVSGSVRSKTLVGKTVSMQATVVVTAVNTATGQIFVTVPTAANVSTSCSAVNQSNGGVGMIGLISGTTLQIIPLSGTLANNTYLAQCTYEST